MSFGISDPITGELAANKASKDGSDITNPADWRTALELDTVVPEAAAAALATKATAGGVRFDGVSTLGGFLTSGNGFDLGANDFTCYWQGVVADKSVNRVYQNVLSQTNINNYAGFGALSTGAFAIQSNGYAGASLAAPATATTLVDQYVGQTISVIWGRASAVWFMYVNGSPVALSGGNSCAAAAFDVSDIRGALTSTTPASGEHKSRSIFNRALTADEVATLHRDGLAAIPALGGWGAAKQTFDFESGLQGEVIVNGGGSAGSIALNTTSPISGSQDLLVTITTGVPAYPRVQIPTTYPDVVLKAGNQYRLKFKTKVITGLPFIRGLCWDNSMAQFGATGEPDGLTLVGEQSHEYTFTQTTFRDIGNADRAKLTIFHSTESTGSSYQIDDIEIEPLGSLAAYPMDDGIGRQLRDLHPTDPKPALLSATGFEHLLPRTEGVLRQKDADRTTSSRWLSDDDILPANAVLQEIIVDGTRAAITAAQTLTQRRIYITNTGGTLTFSRTSGTTAGTTIATFTPANVADCDITVKYIQNP